MKIISNTAQAPKLRCLSEMGVNRTYKDVTTGDIWLSTFSGWVNLSENRIITKSENMPGGVSPIPRWLEVVCTVDVREE